MSDTIIIKLRKGFLFLTERLAKTRGKEKASKADIRVRLPNHQQEVDKIFCMPREREQAA